MANPLQSTSEKLKQLSHVGESASKGDDVEKVVQHKEGDQPLSGEQPSVRLLNLQPVAPVKVISIPKTPDPFVKSTKPTKLIIKPPPNVVPLPPGPQPSSVSGKQHQKFGEPAVFVSGSVSGKTSSVSGKNQQASPQAAAIISGSGKTSSVSHADGRMDAPKGCGSGEGGVNKEASHGDQAPSAGSGNGDDDKDPSSNNSKPLQDGGKEDVRTFRDFPGIHILSPPEAAEAGAYSVGTAIQAKGIGFWYYGVVSGVAWVNTTKRTGLAYTANFGRNPAEQKRIGDWNDSWWPASSFRKALPCNWLTKPVTIKRQYQDIAKISYDKTIIMEGANRDKQKFAILENDEWNATLHLIRREGNNFIIAKRDYSASTITFSPCSRGQILKRLDLPPDIFDHEEEKDCAAFPPLDPFPTHYNDEIAIVPAISYKCNEDKCGLSFIALDQKHLHSALVHGKAAGRFIPEKNLQKEQSEKKSKGSKKKSEKHVVHSATKSATDVHSATKSATDAHLPTKSASVLNNSLEADNSAAPARSDDMFSPEASPERPHSPRQEDSGDAEEDENATDDKSASPVASGEASEDGDSSDSGGSDYDDVAESSRKPSKGKGRKTSKQSGCLSKKQLEDAKKIKKQKTDMANLQQAVKALKTKRKALSRAQKEKLQFNPVQLEEIKGILTTIVKKELKEDKDADQQMTESKLHEFIRHTVTEEVHSVMSLRLPEENTVANRMKVLMEEPSHEALRKSYRSLRLGFRWLKKKGKEERDKFQQQITSLNTKIAALQNDQRRSCSRAKSAAGRSSRVSSGHRAAQNKSSSSSSSSSNNSSSAGEEPLVLSSNELLNESAKPLEQAKLQLGSPVTDEQLQETVTPSTAAVAAKASSTAETAAAPTPPPAGRTETEIDIENDGEPAATPPSPVPPATPTVATPPSTVPPATPTVPVEPEITIDDDAAEVEPAAEPAEPTATDPTKTPKHGKDTLRQLMMNDPASAEKREAMIKQLREKREKAKQAKRELTLETLESPNAEHDSNVLKKPEDCPKEPTKKSKIPESSPKKPDDSAKKPDDSAKKPDDRIEKPAESVFVQPVHNEAQLSAARIRPRPTETLLERRKLRLRSKILVNNPGSEASNPDDSDSEPSTLPKPNFTVLMHGIKVRLYRRKGVRYEQWAEPVKPEGQTFLDSTLHFELPPKPYKLRVAYKKDSQKIVLDPHLPVSAENLSYAIANCSWPLERKEDYLRYLHFKMKANPFGQFKLEDLHSAYIDEELELYEARMNDIYQLFGNRFEAQIEDEQHRLHEIAMKRKQSSSEYSPSEDDEHAGRPRKKNSHTVIQKKNRISKKPSRKPSSGSDRSTSATSTKRNLQKPVQRRSSSTSDSSQSSSSSDDSSSSNDSTSPSTQRVVKPSKTKKQESRKHATTSRRPKLSKKADSSKPSKLSSEPKAKENMSKKPKQSEKPDEPLSENTQKSEETHRAKKPKKRKLPQSPSNNNSEGAAAQDLQKRTEPATSPTAKKKKIPAPQELDVETENDQQGKFLLETTPVTTKKKKKKRGSAASSVERVSSRSSVNHTNQKAPPETPTFQGVADVSHYVNTQDLDFDFNFNLQPTTPVLPAAAAAASSASSTVQSSSADPSASSASNAQPPPEQQQPLGKCDPNVIKYSREKARQKFTIYVALVNTWALLNPPLRPIVKGKEYDELPLDNPDDPDPWLNCSDIFPPVQLQTIFSQPCKYISFERGLDCAVQVFEQYKVVVAENEKLQAKLAAGVKLKQDPTKIKDNIYHELQEYIFQQKISECDQVPEFNVPHTYISSYADLFRRQPLLRVEALIIARKVINYLRRGSRLPQLTEHQWVLATLCSGSQISNSENARRTRQNRKEKAKTKAEEHRKMAEEEEKRQQKREERRRLREAEAGPAGSKSADDPLNDTDLVFAKKKKKKSKHKHTSNNKSPSPSHSRVAEDPQEAQPEQEATASSSQKMDESEVFLPKPKKKKKDKKHKHHKEKS